MELNRQHYVILLWSANQVCHGPGYFSISVQHCCHIPESPLQSRISQSTWDTWAWPELWRDRQLLWSFEKFNWLLNFSDKLEILFLTEFHHCYHKLHVFAPALLHHAMAVNSQDLFTSAFENFTRITIITLLVKSFELAPPQESKSTALCSHTCDMFDTRGWDIFRAFKNSYSSIHRGPLWY